MSMRVHEVRLLSDQDFGKRLPPKQLGYFLAELPTVIQQSISMSFRQRSSLQGRRPPWLDRAGDIRFVDHSSKGGSVLLFEAPTFGDAAPELYQQGELWPTRPSGNDTGFDLFGDVLADVTTNNDDSEHFDPTLLKGLMRFKRVFTGPFRGMDFTSTRSDREQHLQLTPSTLQRVQTFLGETPSPRRVRIVGKLDMMRISTQTFVVHLDTGEEVRGILPDDGMDEAKSLLNQRVLILGKAVYRASGRLLRIEADSVTVGETESSLWSRIPKPGTAKINGFKWHKPQGSRSGMAAILGKWPGEETDQQVRAALAKLS